MSKNEIDQITTRDEEQAAENHFRETLRMLRACDPEAISAQGEVDVQTITQQFEIIVEHEFGLIEWGIDDHLTYRKYRCEDCGRVKEFPGAPGFCGSDKCDTWDASWTDLGDDESDADDEEDDDG